MKKVTIYTTTSTKKLKAEIGYYAAIVEYITRDGPVSRPVVGFEKNTTYNRLVLQAIISGLCALNQPCEVTIHTDSAFVRSQINREMPEKWRRSEWIKSDGDGVKYTDLWQQYLEAKGEHKITANPNDYEGLPEYLEKMDKLMKKLEKQGANPRER